MRYSIWRRCVLSCPFDLNNLNRSTRFYRLIVHLHNNMIVIALSFLLLLSISVGAQDRESKGELHIYPRATQIGIVANREFKDQKGRVVKVIYYGYDDYSTNNFREELLRERSSRTSEYDEYGCPIKSKSYDHLLNLTAVEEVRCAEGTSIPLLSTSRNSSDIKQRETRHTETGGAKTILEFDSTGEKVIGITGEFPDDTDLVHGWGNVLNGLAVGIAPNRESGAQHDLSVNVTIKNVDNDSSDLMLSPVLFELKHSNGQVIQEKMFRLSNSNKIESGACPNYMRMGAPRAGRASILYSLNLGEMYDPLPPGKYSMTITYCVSQDLERLVSNTIQLEVK